MAFQLTLGTVEVNLSNLVPDSGSILYDNGQFAGFDAQFEFAMNGRQFLFRKPATPGTSSFSKMASPPEIF
jgi:hypothetical protein